MQLHNKTTNTKISDQVLVADTFYSRCKGLLGRQNFAEDQTLWIRRCPSIHTFFMKFAIDVVFHDRNMKVTCVVEDIQPWGMTKMFQYQNDSCFEFAAQNISQLIRKGDILYVRP